VPKCEGGSDCFANLVLLHPNCHRRLHATGLTLESRPL
jgi:predicted HNH restriction endonuclease